MPLKKTIGLSIKILIIVLSYGFIVYKLYNYDNITDAVNPLFSGTTESILIIFSLFLLMFINWITESYKWKFLISKTEKISIYAAVKAVLAGISVSIFTPNRTGEFIGRVLILNPKNRYKSVFATIIGSISQLLITIIAGLAGISLFLYIYPEKTIFEKHTEIIIALFGIIAAIGTILYFKPGVLKQFFDLIPFLNRLHKYYNIISKYKFAELMTVMLLSILRYIVFLLQFYMLFQIFDIDVTFIESFISVSIIYVIMAIIPTITLAEIGIRGSVAIFIMESFTDKSTEVLSSSILLWVINLAIPALIGALIIPGLRIFPKNKQKQTLKR